MGQNPSIGVKAIIIKDDQLLTIYKHNATANDEPFYILPGGK